PRQVVAMTESRDTGSRAPGTAHVIEHVIAPAKLTLSLRVTGVRPDGYHLIDAEMTTLDLHDRLAIRNLADADPARESRVTFSGPFAAGLVDDDRNLVRRALNYAGRRADVMLEKNIPHGGGLGGGSADAAAVLRWAGISSENVSGDEFSNDLALDLAMKLGADVPFCLAGGRARASGVGEIIEPVEHRPNMVTLVVPPFSVSTPAVYRAWDELGGPTSEGPNDLEPAALLVEPRLAIWRDAILEVTGRAPVLAGSGATLFVPADVNVNEIREGLRRLLGAEFSGDGNAQVVVARHL
ncbi:MAG: 4-(cytidine 5'-diphospho)-2-C-methyl-D-erythritol kinase, partial [Actinomycetota bacterium]